MRSGDLAEPAELVPGDEWTFTIKEGENGANRRISVNYDGFVEDVAVGDELLVDGGIMTFELMDISATDVVAKVRHSTSAPRLLLIVTGTCASAWTPPCSVVAIACSNPAVVSGEQAMCAALACSAGMQVVDGGSMGSRRHLNIRGKTANLPAITERDWRDIDFGIKMGVDFYALSFVRDADCIYELQAYLKRHGSHAKVRSNVSGAVVYRV